MAKWLLVVQANSSDPAREAELNEWYDKTHLPDMLTVPGVITATRYENTDPSEGKAKFIAIYEIEADDIGETKKAVSDHVARWRAAGRLSELLKVASMDYYRQLSSLPK